jgi:hypothetical protein
MTAPAPIGGKGAKGAHVLKFGPAVVLLGFTLPAWGQYAGPAILSRGEAPTGLVAPEIRFTPYVGVSATFDSGLANVSVNSQGGLASNSSEGATLVWGISGTHTWRRSRLGLSYSGGIDHFFKQGSFDSLNQSVFLGIDHRFSRRLTFSLHTAAGMFNRLTSPVGLQQAVPYDPASVYVPTTDFFDNRTIYLSGTAGVSYQKTARLSFSFGAVGAIVRRRSSALYGTIGFGGNADVQYRITRHSTLGAAYGYSHYEFTRVFGGTDAQQVALTYGLRLTPKTEFSGYGGAAIVESKFVAQVPLDPAIAILLGVPSATYVSYSRTWQPAYSARLSRVFLKGVAFAGLAHEIVPGNGLFLTSSGTSIIGGYDYGGRWRHWSIGTSSNYSQQRAIGGSLRAHYSSVAGGVSASRQLFRYTQFVMGFGIRHYSSPDYNAYNRFVYSVHVGLGFAPGEVPLRMW